MRYKSSFTGVLVGLLLLNFGVTMDAMAHQDYKCGGKVGAEFCKRGDEVLLAPEFVPSIEHRIINNKKFIDLDYIQYRHPVSGTWSGIGKLARNDDDEELVIFLVLVSYDQKDDYERIANVFASPLQVNMDRLRSKQHNWIEENFDIKNLPKNTSVDYWLGYNGGVVPHNDKKLNIQSFIAKGNSHRNGNRLFPLQVKPKQYIYMKLYVLEETGHTRLRKISEKLAKNKVDHEFIVDVVKEGVGSGGIKAVYTVLKAVGSKVANNLIQQQLGSNPLIDLEYFYESKKGDTQIYMHHKRPWRNNPDIETSFELKLIETNGQYYVNPNTEETNNIFQDRR